LDEAADSGAPSSFDRLAIFSADPEQKQVPCILRGCVSPTDCWFALVLELYRHGVICSKGQIPKPRWQNDDASSRFLVLGFFLHLTVFLSIHFSKCALAVGNKLYGR
jgi:hypothetical protein